MAYFEPYIDADGVHIPTYFDVIDYFVAQYKTIFGEDVYLGEETPDYQMLSVVAKCISDFSVLATQAYNDRNPQYASGDALDVLVQFAGLTRRLPTASTVTLTITGTEGSEIEAGSQVVDGSGNLWSTDSAVTIPEAGTVTVSATCDTLGAIIAPAGTIESIYTPVVGWSAVTNEESATIGLAMETDAELRERFAVSHSLTASGITDSIITGLLSLDGVKYATVVQNDTDSTDSNGLPAHSFCAVVDGGDNDEIAEKILSLKAPGVATYGSVTKTVVDEHGTSNTIKFSHPAQTTVSVTVTRIKLDGYDDDRIDSIMKQSLINDINGLGIGKSWNVTMGYKDIYSHFDSGDMPFSITSITATDASNNIVPCTYDHILFTDEDHITIVSPGG